MGQIYDSKLFRSGSKSNAGVTKVYIPFHNLCVAVDSSNQVWVGTDHNGLYTFDGNRWIAFDTSNSSLPGNHVREIHIDSKQDVWADVNESAIRDLELLVKYTQNDWQKFPLIKSEKFTIDKQGVIWFANRKGLFTYNEQQRQPTKVHFPVSNFVANDETLIPDNTGNIWISSKLEGNQNSWGGWENVIYPKGVARVGSSTIDLFGINENDSLFNDSFSALFADRDNQIWGTANDNGQEFLWKLVKESKHSNEYRWKSRIAIPADILLCGTFDRMNRLWLGTNEDGLLMYDGSAWTTYTTENSILPDNTIQDIALDAKGNLWVVSYNGITYLKIVK